MAFEPGNQLAAGRRPRHIFDAIIREVAQNPAKLKDAIAAQLDAAQNGDLDALDWIACRLEGKPAQSVTVSGDEDKPLISLIRTVVLHAAMPEQSQVIEHAPQPALPDEPVAAPVAECDTRLT